MKFTFTLYVQHHADGAFTASLADLPDVCAHATSLEHCRELVRRAAARRIREADPDEIGRWQTRRVYRTETVDIEISTHDALRRARKKTLPLKLLTLLADYQGGFVARIPKLDLTFYVQERRQIEAIVRDEARAFFHNRASGDILQYAHAQLEYIEPLDVEAQPRSPEEVYREKDEEDKHLSLSQAGENITDRLKNRKEPCAYGIAAQLEEVIRSLTSDVRRSLLLIGPTGVGKTALVDELARRIARKDCAESLRGRSLWRLNAQRIEALQVWWEKGLMDIVEECRKKNHILHVTNLIDLLEGATTYTRGGEMANFLKDFIVAGDILVIGETTPERYAAHAATGGGFLNLFKPIRLVEPDAATFESILLNVRRSLETERATVIAPDAVSAAVDLTRRFMPYVAFPGKAVSLLQRAVARRGTEKLTRSGVVREFSTQTGLPSFMLDDTQKLDIDEAREFFTERLISQPDAVEAVTDLISVVKAGLNDPQKPLGAFLLVGPTGTGKTWLAKCLAEYLFGNADRMVRLDMSEYSGYDAIERMIGVPGRSHTGVLTSRVTEQPFSVILLDEIEKASEPIFDVLLQVLGEGRLTDSRGVTVDFRNCVILMTSNLGARRGGGGGSIGFSGPGKESHDRYLANIEEFFRPEFVNRIDKVVVFRPLSRESMNAIIARELNSLHAREGLARHRIATEIDPGVIDLLAEKGFHPDYGARPLKRAIEALIAVPIARLLTGKRCSEDTLLKVVREKDATRVDARAVREAKPRVRTHIAGISDIVPGESRRISIDKLAEEISSLRRSMQQWKESDKAARLRRTFQQCLNRASKKTFFQSDGEEIRRNMRRIYHLERVLKRLDQVHSDSCFLEEMAELLRKDRDRQMYSQVCRKFDDLRIAAGFLEIELASSDEEANNRSLMILHCVAPYPGDVGASEWLRSAAAMYASWFHRKGFTYTFGHVRLPRTDGEYPQLEIIEGEQLGNVLKQIRELRVPMRMACLLEGANVLGFMRGEAGIHRLRGKLSDTDPGSEKPRLVRIAVQPCSPDETLAEWHAAAVKNAGDRRKNPIHWESALQSDAERRIDEVVRNYHVARDGSRVDDPRTGLETTNVRDVLDGDLDAFVLAHLRSEMERQRAMRDSSEDE